MSYAFRITSSYSSLLPFVKRMADVCDVLAVYEHSADVSIKRTHIHGYCEGLTVSTDTLKNWVKKALGVKTFPKTDWEFAEKISKGVDKGKPVNRNALVYFHKGKYPILFSKGLSEEEIQEKHKVSYSPENLVKVEYKLVKQENPQERKKRHWDLMKDMVKEYEKGNGGYFDYERAVRIVVQVLKSNQLLISEYKVKEYVLSIMGHVNESGLIARLAQFCSPRL